MLIQLSELGRLRKWERIRVNWTNLSEMEAWKKAETTKLPWRMREIRGNAARIDILVQLSTQSSIFLKKYLLDHQGEGRIHQQVYIHEWRHMDEELTLNEIHSSFSLYSIEYTTLSLSFYHKSAAGNGDSRFHVSPFPSLPTPSLNQGIESMYLTSRGGSPSWMNRSRRRGCSIYMNSSWWTRSFPIREIWSRSIWSPSNCLSSRKKTTSYKEEERSKINRKKGRTYWLEIECVHWRLVEEHRNRETMISFVSTVLELFFSRMKEEWDLKKKNEDMKEEIVMETRELLRWEGERSNWVWKRNSFSSHYFNWQVRVVKINSGERRRREQ